MNNQGDGEFPLFAPHPHLEILRESGEKNNYRIGGDF